MDTSRAPMGWNSWDCYGAAVTEKIVLQNAAYMAEHLRPLGYTYVVVDIQWSAPQARNNEYIPFTELEMDDPLGRGHLRAHSPLPADFRRCLQMFGLGK